MRWHASVTLTIPCSLIPCWHEMCHLPSEPLASQTVQRRLVLAGWQNSPGFTLLRALPTTKASPHFNLNFSCKPTNSKEFLFLLLMPTYHSVQLFMLQNQGVPDLFLFSRHAFDHATDSTDVSSFHATTSPKLQPFDNSLTNSAPQSEHHASQSSSDQEHWVDLRSTSEQ